MCCTRMFEFMCLDVSDIEIEIDSHNKIVNHNKPALYSRKMTYLAFWKNSILKSKKVVNKNSI